MGPMFLASPPHPPVLQGGIKLIAIDFSRRLVYIALMEASGTGEQRAAGEPGMSQAPKTRNTGRR